MEFDGRHVVVTGSANGIGRALARRFHAEGARVVASDRDSIAPGRGGRRAQRRPGPAAPSALAIDIGTEAGNQHLVAFAEDAFGPIDLFFANAGVAVGTDLSTSEAEWELAFNVNVHAHRWAAKYLLPGWLARGEGYFCSTASAAGLLSQIGSAPYSLTKHAAVAFAEWMSITYGDQGFGSAACARRASTPTCSTVVRSPRLERRRRRARLRRGAGARRRRRGGRRASIRAETFLILPHPEVLTYLQRKTGDYDRWLAGMRKLQARIMGG